MQINASRWYLNLYLNLFNWQSNSLVGVCKASAHEKYSNKEINMTLCHLNSTIVVKNNKVY
jgi:hypothetical protein